ncbi:568_t:CDS:1, partial [Dentiscutata heterogama]
EYLLVELVGEEQGIGDVRNLGKRKHDEHLVNEKPNKRGSRKRH